MRWRFWRRDNGTEAVLAEAEAERKLQRARRDWPKVQETHDQLVEWIERGLRAR